MSDPDDLVTMHPVIAGARRSLRNGAAARGRRHGHNLVLGNGMRSATDSKDPAGTTMGDRTSVLWAPIPRRVHPTNHAANRRLDPPPRRLAPALLEVLQHSRY